MIVLHAHWRPPAAPRDSGALLLWAESGEGPSPARLRGRLPARPKLRPHPYALDAAALRALPVLAEGLAEGPAEGTAAEAAEAELRLRLPSTRSGPRPSPRLWQDWDLDARTPPFLAPWSIPALRLDPADGLLLLWSLPGAEELPPGLRLGDDLGFWQAACGLVLGGIAAQRAVPLVLPVGEGAHARWLLLLDGPEDGPRLARLRRAMPPVCRAEEQAEAAGEGAEAEGEPPGPRTLLESFLQRGTDALLRRWGAAAAPRIQEARPGADARWLAALFDEDPEIRASALQIDALVRGHRAWLRQLHAAGRGPFRVAFRLEAPLQRAAGAAAEGAPRLEAPAEDEAWRLHLLLQGREDPSLLLPAERLFSGEVDELERLGEAPGRAQETLLAGLAYAARIFPPLEASLAADRPEGLDLDGRQAYAFLRTAAPLLEAAGFALLVPPWWNRPGSRLGLRLHLRPGAREAGAGEQVAGSTLDMDRLLRFRWELAIGDEAIDPEAFQALVALKTPLVRIRGQWVRLDPEQMEAAIRFWEAQDAEGEMALRDALRLGLDEQAEAGGLPLDEVRAEGWLGDWLARLEEPERLEVLPQPQGLRAELRPYQRFGTSWLAFLRRQGLGACLADDMGLGKTIQTLALLLLERERLGGLPAPTLLVCPTSVVTNWRREAERFAPELRVRVHQGPDRLEGDAFVEDAEAQDLVLTSYALVRRDRETLGRLRWHGLVLDEAQNIKNAAAKQTRAVLGLEADFRLALTGTPVENRLSELRSIMRFLNPGLLPGRKAFRRDFALPIERYGDEAAARRLRGLVGPFILRRLKTDPSVIDDLPEKVETKAYCPLTEEQATLYQAVVEEALADLDESGGVQRRGQVLRMLMQLKQICNHPLQFLHQGAGEAEDPDEVLARSGKLQRLVALLAELLAAGDRALVFTQFTEMGEILQRQLPRALGAGTLFLHGGQSAKAREALLDRFRAPEGPPILILSLKAGGTGLNLVEASHVFHYDRWWNPAVEDQATDRAFRIGQTRRVQVHKLVTTGTFEEHIDEMIERKRSLAESVVGAGEEALTELSTEALREAIRLRT